MVKVIELHLVCRERANVSNETEESFESGFWKIDEKKLQETEPIHIGLHQEKTQVSYLQGRLTGVRIEDARVILEVSKTGQPMVWRGGGSGEKGFLYSGVKDIEHLPQVPIDMSKILKPGKNEPIRGLLETKSWSYPLESELPPDQPALDQNLQDWFEDQIIKI